ncbi:MAG TPA: heparan-alpha-glucosaminide N-acetyltransferase domain-containing protein [Polyangiaceae bacterium]|nr:heparan-alpha-glucosaminide N-acetyltransferase domain-containing protein [Polyangiaceae bacterium]
MNQPNEQGLPAEVAPAARAPRNEAIDLLRGAVMVLMVLDHARDFFFGVQVRATDLAETTVPLFVSRWVTHVCAPAFVFLAGTSAYLYGVRHGREKARRFLLTRGLWLVLLELTVVRLCWLPDPGYHFTLVQVIWALGWSMVALAGLSLLRPPVVAGIGALVVAGHNLLDGIKPANFGALGPLWTILHQPGMLEPAPGHKVYVSYVLLPWVGVMALGYGAGALFERPAEQRRRTLLRAGLGAIAAFVVLRALNGYGDPTPWAPQARGPLFTLLSFVNCQKYPPSLLFLLMTLGPTLCLLAAVDGRPLSRAARPLVVFGKVPLLFYVAHLVLLRYTSAPLAVARWGLPAAFQLPPTGHAGSPEYDLWVTVLVWGLALALLYPLCRWFAGLKARRTDRWLSYL